ncbi:cyclically-permuted mutarotase family protein [Prevotella sp. oral taxon 376]|nr:cyclically-permuted mutarotase family protein [Prevotella sp. oral taxon 376]
MGNMRYAEQLEYVVKGISRKVGMKLKIILFVIMGLSITSCCMGESYVLQRMYGFPFQEAGYEKGVSACFAGYIGRTLLVAGGCNFPGKPACEGGRKKYYNGIYAAITGNGDQLLWRKVGELPTASAYGVSVSWHDQVIMVGGNNEQGSLKGVCAVTLKGEKALVSSLPSLPVTMDNMTGCLVGNLLYVAGGNVEGRASRKAYCMDLASADKGWYRLPDLPGDVRVQPVSGMTTKGAFCVWGGFRPKSELEAAALSFDGWAYDTDTRTWRHLPAPVDMEGSEVFLGGGTAANLGTEMVVAVGGVNKEVFLSALNHPQPGYMTHEPEWYKFNPLVLVYGDGSWRVMGKEKVAARAGAILVPVSGDLYIIGGELKPGIRTPDIFRLRFSSRELQ